MISLDDQEEDDTLLIQVLTNSLSAFSSNAPNTFWVPLLFQVLWLSMGSEGVRHSSQGQFPTRFVLIFSTVVSRWFPFPSCLSSIRKWQTFCIFHGCRYFWGFHSLIHMTIGSGHRRLFRQSCDCTIVCSYTLVLPHDPSQVPSATLAWKLRLSVFLWWELLFPLWGSNMQTKLFYQENIWILFLIETYNMAHI